MYKLYIKNNGTYKSPQRFESYREAKANAREIKRQLGISLTTLFMACTGRQKSACGYIWKYGENPKKIIQYNLNGEIIKTWKRVQDIEKECKVDKTSIYKCCTGKQKTAKGFIWRYAV